MNAHTLRSTLLVMTIQAGEDVVSARQRARQIANLLEFDVQAQTSIATVVSEMARNAYTYAGSGKLEFYLLDKQDYPCFAIDITDAGPGIEHLPAILAGNFKSRTGLGLGIAGAKRMMDEFTIQSTPGRGTQVTLAMHLPKSILPLSTTLLARISQELARYRPSGASEEVQQQNQELLRALDLLGKARDELEQRVKERTAQLSLANAELRQEVSERIKTQVSLQEVTERLSLALQSACMATWSYDVIKQQLHWDNHMPALFGLAAKVSELSFHEYLNFIHADDSQQVAEQMQLSIDACKDYTTEFRVIWPDQSVHILSMRGKVYCDERNIATRMTGLCWDITEQRQAEELARQQQLELAQYTRASSMGEMASALAHELSQPLAAIVNFVQGSILRLEALKLADAEIISIMQQAHQQAIRAGNIIHRIKNFARKGELIIEAVNINNLITEMVKIIRYEKRVVNISYQLELDNNLVAIKVDKTQIEQVLLNIMRNGIESMQDNGVKQPLLQIKTSSCDNDHIKIDIIDNGPGFSEHAKDKMMEPYFTTKPYGMGMGLAICRTIVEAHGGRLSAITEPDQGAWLQLILPLNAAIHHD